ncbi:hypothetical protein CPC08DRAFT_710984 [Agrocybe pediades]|nr:hypothetical protein CPC08DRAFT_710984 [Agrocybe pediades]
MPSRRSFNRLRSFHLSPQEVVNARPSPQAPAGGTTPAKRKDSLRKNSVSLTAPPRPVNMSIPLRGSTIVTLAIIASIFFIMAISMAFLGADADEPYFKRTLDTVAATNPGVVLVGESVDVDIDEPSITIRWSIAACGEDFMLPGSAGLHGSSLCGLPSMAMYFFVDNDETPAATYDPLQIPFNRDTGHRRSIQNLVQFDSDHVLDVHEARLYPFDNYKLSSTLRAMSFDNQSIPIRKAVTIDITSSFDIFTIDLDSYSTSANGTQTVSRDIDMYVSRPNGARFFTLILFAVSWVLTHVTMGHVLIARKLPTLKAVFPHLLSSGAILIALPQIRNSMPDAPGLDGVLIDCIGFFPQMMIAGISTVILLLILGAREFDSMRSPRPPVHPLPPMRPRPTSIISQFPRPPPSPTEFSSSQEITQWEMHRLLKHLKGEYVFPPVRSSHRIQPSDPSSPAHRRIKTMSKIMEEGDASHWNDRD